MNEFLIALAGGSVGSVLTMLGSVPLQVRANDRLAMEADSDLAQWVADDFIRAKRDAVKRVHELQDRGVMDNQSRTAAIAAVKEEALHAYRDQETKAFRRMAELRDTEAWRHSFWRTVTRRGPLTELHTPERARPIIEAWAAGTDVHDPTRWTLDDAVEQTKRDAANPGGAM